MAKECRLCGYPAVEYLPFAVPLASPPKVHPLCSDCLEELLMLAKERLLASKGMGA